MHVARDARAQVFLCTGLSQGRFVPAVCVQLFGETRAQQYAELCMLARKKCRIPESAQKVLPKRPQGHCLIAMAA